MNSVGIIGGGASGLFLACVIANETNGHCKISIYERKDRVGKKILATGSGRCNFTNINVTAEDYMGENKDFVKHAITEFSVEKTINYFEEMGLLFKVEYGGRVFPYSEKASSVLDVLRNFLAKYNVEFITNTKIVSVKTEKNLFLISDENKNKFNHDYLVVAAGGKSRLSLGSDGSGFDILKNLGHRITKISPALAQLKTETNLTKPLQGIRINANVKAIHLDRIIAEIEGDVLFTNYGLSGTAIEDISYVLHKFDNLTLSIDVMKEFKHEEVKSLLNKRKKILNHLTMEEFFSGLINKKIGQLIFKHIFNEKLSFEVKNLSDRHILLLTNTLKALEIKILETTGWENSQVTAGGADTKFFNEKTMESKKIADFFCVGEVLDIFGGCGGYNLQWAWSSAYIAGKTISQRILN